MIRIRKPVQRFAPNPSARALARLACQRVIRKCRIQQHIADRHASAKPKQT